MSEEKELRLSDLQQNTGEPSTIDTNTVSTADPQALGQMLQQKHNIAPRPTDEKFKSYEDEVIQKYGLKAVEETFERAKNIVETKRAEIEMQNPNQEFVPNNEDFMESNVPVTHEDIEEEIEVIEPTVQVQHHQPQPVVTNNIIKDDIEEEIGDIGSLVSELEEDIDGEDRFNVVKSKIKEKIKPVVDKIDLASFTISNKPISIVKAFENAHSNEVYVADWILYDTEAIISVKEMKGYDIEKLNPSNSQRNQYNTYKEIYTTIYDHIIGDKPSFEEFLRLVKFSDIDDLYFAIYRASFDKQNFVTYQCMKDKCNEVFVEEIDTDEMFKFETQEIEDKFNDIIAQGKVLNPETKYEVEMVQISDSYIVALKEPSIYDVIFETSMLDEAFSKKYADIIGMLSYIDNIYYINKETKSLEPIELKIYDNDQVRSIKYRIVQYSKIIKNLSSDQYYNLASIISKITQSKSVKYILPERVCPKCGHKIEEEETSPETMLFTRHQLGAIGAI